MRLAPLQDVVALVRGATDCELSDGALSPVRLAAWTRARQADRWIELWSAHSLGVRLVTLTAATRVELVTTVTRMVPADATEPPFPSSAVATVDGAVVARAAITAGPLIVNLPDRTWREVDGPSVRLTFDLGDAEEEREVTLWLPHNGHAVIHEVSSDAPLAPAPPSGRPLWVHHGSSVSHGLEAVDPLGPWPQQASRSLGLDLTNLAIAGNAQLDPFVARTIAAHPADIITLKLGVNTVNVDSMRRRAFVPALHGFLDLVREGHPETPLVVLGPIACPAIEDTPGPTWKAADGFYRGTPREVVPGDGTLTLGLARELVRETVESRMPSDPMLWSDDGLALFGPADTDLLWDGLHPNQAGYDLIARRFADRAGDPSTPLGAAFALLWD